MYSLDKSLHVLMAEVRYRHPTVPIVNGKIQDLIGQLGVIKAVFVFLPLPNVAGAAHLGQADLGDGLPIFYAWREEDGLIDAVVPDPKGVPRGRAAAAVQVEARCSAYAGGARADSRRPLVVLQQARCQQRSPPHLVASVSHQIN